MSLYNLLLVFFVIKALLLWPFYYKLKWKPLLVGIAGSLAVAPLLTILYHETAIDFWLVYFIYIIFDGLLYYFLLQRVWWKALLVSAFLNTIVMVCFVIGNG